MLQTRTHANGVVTIGSTILESAGVPHAFSTRIGGVSHGAFASLNLGNPQGAIRDSEANIHENYLKLFAALGLSGRVLCRVHQVHGRALVTLRNGDAPPTGQQADGLITDSRAFTLSIRTADCVPILIAAKSGSLVAAVHAGWRGIVAGILPEALSALHHLGVPVSDMLVAIGPCIGAEAFEVGEEVAEEFVRAIGHHAPIRRDFGPKPHIDLVRAAVHQARHFGVPENAIDHGDFCTVRDSGLFYSHRRDCGLTGRLAAVISPRS